MCYDLVPLKLTPHIFCILLLLIGTSRPKTSTDFKNEVKNLRLAFIDMFLKHRTLARELQSHRDLDAKNKAELKRLKGKILTPIVLYSFLPTCEIICQILS